MAPSAVQSLNHSERMAVIDGLIDTLAVRMSAEQLTYHEIGDFIKKRLLQRVLKSCGYNQCKAARQLGIHRNTLSRTARELELETRPPRPEKRVNRRHRGQGRVRLPSGPPRPRPQSAALVLRPVRSRAEVDYEKGVLASQMYPNA